jgi:hypothetical protein
MTNYNPYGYAVSDELAAGIRQLQTEADDILTSLGGIGAAVTALCGSKGVEVSGVIERVYLHGGAPERHRVVIRTAEGRQFLALPSAVRAAAPED